VTPDRARTLLHAYLDGELDAASTMELDGEIDRSPALRQELARLSALQNALRAGAARFQAPRGLAERAFAAVAAPQAMSSDKVPWWWRAWAIGASAVAAVLLIWALGSGVFTAHRSASSIQEVVSAHIRSLMADHLTDLASAERHSVKPWLSNRLDFAPPVQDLDSHGFHLVGGRLDYLGGKAVAAVVYRHRQHLINVFVWPAAEEASADVREANERGYNTVRFHSRGMNYWAVSDVNMQDLHKLAGLMLSQ
jgi:anti-sigma factor RsiW